MKKLLTQLLIAFVLPFGLFSQTDITSTLVKNADFTQVDDKGRPSYWGFFASKNKGAEGSLMAEDGAAKIEVTKAADIFHISLSSNYGKTISSKDIDFSGKKIAFSCKAKSLNAGSKFRFRVKANYTGSVTYKAIGNTHNLTTDYQIFTATYDVPQDNTELNVQILCGAAVDTYFFDDFKVELEE